MTFQVNIDEDTVNSDDSTNSSINISNESSVYEHESLSNESDHASLRTSESPEIAQNLSDSENDNLTDEEMEIVNGKNIWI